MKTEVKYNSRAFACITDLRSMYVSEEVMADSARNNKEIAQSICSKLSHNKEL